MKIGGLQRVSFIDYPGEICAVVFCQGCNFRCSYCHNPELVNPVLYAECNPEAEILSFLEKRVGRLDAVTVTGGEPTIQKDLPSFLAWLKCRGYLVKLDTNGSMPVVLKQLIGEKLVDYIAMDIKGPLEKYGDITRAPFSPDDIQETIQLIMNSGLKYEFRTTVVDSLLTEEDLLAVGRLISGARRYVLQPFVSSKVLDIRYLNAKPIPMEILEKIRIKLEKNMDSVILRHQE